MNALSQFTRQFFIRKPKPNLETNSMNVFSSNSPSGGLISSNEMKKHACRRPDGKAVTYYNSNQEKLESDIIAQCLIELM